MKKFIAFALMAFTLSGLAQHRVQVQANCQVNAREAVCVACNEYYARPVFCQLEAIGFSRLGSVATDIQVGVVGPGQCLIARVFARNPMVDPIVDARTNANCNF